MMGAISLLIFFTTGGIAAFTLIGTIANIPIVCFFTSIACMLLVSKVHKPGTFFIMGFINVLPGIMAANFTGVLLSAIGWGIADLFASLKNYRGKKILISAYVLGCTLQSALFTLPMYLYPAGSTSSKEKNCCDYRTRCCKNIYPILSGRYSESILF